jgi:hypothetical protein
MNKEYLKNFKDGVADALLKGNMAEEYFDGYKQGYDFGMVMFSEISEKTDHYVSELLEEKGEEKRMLKYHSSAKNIWVFKFRESGDEDDVVVFDSKPSREQMDEVLLEYLDQLFIDHETTPAEERAKREDPNKFLYDLYYEDLWERNLLKGEKK